MDIYFSFIEHRISQRYKKLQNIMKKKPMRRNKKEVNGKTITEIHDPGNIYIQIYMTRMSSKTLSHSLTKEKN